MNSKKAKLDVLRRFWRKNIEYMKSFAKANRDHKVMMFAQKAEDINDKLRDYVLYHFLEKCIRAN